MAAAQTKTSMTDEHIRKIEANYNDIVKRVQAEDIMDEFVDEGYFSIGDVVEGIMMEKTPQNKTEKLVQLLHDKLLHDKIAQDGIFDFFLRQMEKHNNEDLAKKIRETEKSPIQVSENRADAEGYPEIPDKLKTQIVTEQQAMSLSNTFPLQERTCEIFGGCLGLDSVEISHIQMDYRQHTGSTVIQKLIGMWKNKNGHKATLETLLNLFQKKSQTIGLNRERYKKALNKIIMS